MISTLRMLFGVLFVCGCWFAWIAWFVIPLSLVAMAEHNFALGEVLPLLVASGLVLSGYFVWLNWLSFAARGRFFGASAITVQAVSLLHHLIWFVLLVRPWGSLTPPDMGHLLWLVINIVVALTTGVMFWCADHRITEPIDAAVSR